MLRNNIQSRPVSEDINIICLLKMIWFIETAFVGVQLSGNIGFKYLTVSHNVLVEDPPFNLFMLNTQYTLYLLTIGKISNLMPLCVVA